MGFYKFRRLKGAGVLLVLLWNLLLFSYHQSAIVNVINQTAGSGDKIHPWQSAIFSAFLMDFLPKLLYPLAGWLADANLGRYKVMRYGMWLMWLGSIMEILTAIIYNGNTVPIEVHAIAYIINALGIAGYHVNVIPFGIDQMEGPSGEQMAAFIHWYYWTRNFNFSVIVQLVVQLFYKKPHAPNKNYQDLTFLMVQMTFLTAALCLDFLFSSKLFKDVKIHDPVKKVTKISAFISKHKHPVGRRQAHTYTYDMPPSRSDFAKKTYRGPFEDDAVEDVVSFWRIALFLVVLHFAGFLVQNGYFFYPSLFEHMNFGDISALSTNEYLVTNVVSLGSFTLCIPFYEFVIHPFLRNRIPRMTIRIGLGLLVVLFGISSLLVTDMAGHLLPPKNFDNCMFYGNSSSHHIPISSFYLVPIIVVMAIGEMLVFISTLEFIVAQSPYGMRGLILGLYFMLYGFFVGFGATILMTFSLGWKYVFPVGKHVKVTCGSSYLITIVLIGFVGFLTYLVSIRKYKERQRGGQVDINPQTVLEGYYESKSVDEQRSTSFGTV